MKQKITSDTFKSTHILVVGDVMLDEYWHGESSRLSPEAPVPVVSVKSSNFKLGGAANVGVNIAHLGAKVTLLGIVGKDSEANKINTLLQEHGINSALICMENCNTTKKLRILSCQQQLIRIDKESLLDIQQDSELFKVFLQYLPTADLLVLSDYNKGVLSNPALFINAAKHANVQVLVDPKKTNLAAYQGATLIKPNLKEFNAFAHHLSGDNETRARLLMQQHNLEHMIITAGEQGLDIISANGPKMHFPSQGNEVFDVTGAGDTVCAMLAISVASQVPLQIAGKLATLAAGIAVSKIGTYAVSITELLNAWHTRDNPGIHSPTELKVIIKNLQAQGYKIAMVNGCYDVLHYGHIYFLQAAKKLADFLIVAVNSDNSVKRIKGNSRPYYSLSDRMQVLAELSSVDWVVSFDEDTPRAIVEYLGPDIIVKSNEYYACAENLDKTAAYNDGITHVLANGGKLHILECLEKSIYSSTRIISAIQ